MERQYQVTLINPSGKYKPVSCIVKTIDMDARIPQNKQRVIQDGIKKICQKRLWKSTDLRRFGYTEVKIREYDLEKIKAENEKRYAAIKEEKYQSGEWKRPEQKTK